MRKGCIIFLLLFILTITLCGLCGGGGAVLLSANQPSSYLRMHVRANSNDNADQAVKYQIKEKIVEYLTPVVAECNSKRQAENALKGELAGVQAVAKKALQNSGFDYGATASLHIEQFPARIYEDLLLPAGEYMALVITLGEGKGDNWWCVVYPPLCFTACGEQTILYKSKILEIIEHFKKGA